MGHLSALVGFNLRFLPQAHLFFLSGNGDLPGFLFSEQRPRRDAQPDNQCGGHSARCGEGELVPANQFLKPVKIARRARHNRFALEMPRQVSRQVIGGFVSSLPIFFQAPHDNPVEVAADEPVQ